MVETGTRNGTAGRAERALLVGVVFPDGPRTYEEPLDELGRLADTAGAEVVGRNLQRRSRPDASTYIGRGKAEEVAAQAEELDADVVIFDSDLMPAQIRNLERILEVRVVDRTELILDIFALHARTLPGVVTVVTRSITIGQVFLCVGQVSMHIFEPAATSWCPPMPCSRYPSECVFTFALKSMSTSVALRKERSTMLTSWPLFRGLA